MKGYSDLFEFSEDERISIIAAKVSRGLVVAVCVDDEPEKVARYKRKVLEACPGAVVDFEGHGPTTGAYTLRFRFQNGSSGDPEAKAGHQ